MHFIISPTFSPTTKQDSRGSCLDHIGFAVFGKGTAAHQWIPLKLTYHYQVASIYTRAEEVSHCKICQIDSVHAT